MKRQETIFGLDCVVTKNKDAVYASGRLNVRGMEMEVVFRKSHELQKIGFEPLAVNRIENGKPVSVWQFKEECNNGRIFVRWCAVSVIDKEEECVIAVCEGRGERRVIKVVPLIELATCAIARDDREEVFYLGGRDIEAMIALKKAVANVLKKFFLLSESESEYSSAVVRLQRERENKEAEAAWSAKQERRREIRARRFVDVYDQNGKKYSGIPVAGDEWTCLYHNKPAVEVASYSNGACGDPLSFFRVVEVGSRKEKNSVVTGLFWQKPVVKAPVVKAKLVTIHYKDSGVKVLPLISREEAKNMAARGVNSGTLIAVEVKEGNAVVVALHKGKVVDSGVYAVL